MSGVENRFLVTIEAVDYEGKGVGHIDGKTVFIDGAIAGEEVLIEIVKRKNNFDKARLIEIIKPSSQRVTPDCPHFGVCGGCSLQHIAFDEQIKIKQQVLLDNLLHIGKINSAEILPPVVGISWGYRHRARLSARYVAKKGGALVGFREKSSSYVADMNECKVLPHFVSDLIPDLKQLVASLSAYGRIPQIEVAVGDEVIVLVFRNMLPLSLDDEDKLRYFVDNHRNDQKPLQVWLQPKGPDSCYPFYPLTAPQLSYSLPAYNLRMPYYPTEFTQVNPRMNSEMVSLAMWLLAPGENDIIGDFFCGIGNFTLAIARSATRVIGIEGSEALVARALQNAQYNALADRVSYQVANLFTVDSSWLEKLVKFDKWLIDPPRDGAVELIKAITPQTAPKLIVYVSCNPATLARDAGVLVQVHGYKLLKTGIMNMFPHTSHVESIAVFEL